MKNFYKKICALQLLEKIKQAILSFSKIEWKIFLIFFSILFITTILLLQNINKYFMVAIPAYGGSIEEGIIGSPRFINPILAQSDADKDLTMLIYSGLTRKDEMGNMIPDLAESFEISKDGLEYTFILKDNIYFHDNKKITVDDIIFTIEKTRDPLSTNQNKINWSGVEINKIDDKTIKFILKKPYVSFLDNTNLGILPAHLWEDPQIELNKHNENPIGSGPYKVKKVNKKSSGVIESYELTSFSKFALKKPYIKDITLKFYKNEEELINALKSGSINQAGSISPLNANILKEDFNIENKILPKIFAIYFNQNKNEIFLDKSTLEIINLSIDKERIINEILFGYGEIISDPILSNIVKNEELKQDNTNIYEENFKKAESLITKNNWTKNEEGVLQKTITDGNKKKKTVKFEFSISTSNMPELIKTAELIKEDLIKIGIKVEVKTFEIGNLNQLVIRPREYDALLFGQTINTEADLYAFWHSSQIKDPGLNVALYTNKKIDKILEDIFVSINKEDRLKKYIEFKKEFKKDNPAVFLYNPYYIYIVSKDLNNFNTKDIINSAERFRNIYNWNLKEEQVWKIFVK